MPPCGASTGSTGMPKSRPQGSRNSPPKDRSTSRSRIPVLNGKGFEYRGAAPRTILRVMSVAAKICGLSSAGAVTAAVGGGAAYLGFVFSPPSPRAVTLDQAARLCADVPPAVARVGLFVDADD